MDRLRGFTGTVSCGLQRTTRTASSMARMRGTGITVS